MGALLALILAWRDSTPPPRPLRHASTAEVGSAVMRSLLSSREFSTTSSLTHVFPSIFFFFFFNWATSCPLKLLISRPFYSATYLVLDAFIGSVW